MIDIMVLDLLNAALHSSLVTRVLTDNFAGWNINAPVTHFFGADTASDSLHSLLGRLIGKWTCEISYINHFRLVAKMM